MEHTKKPHYVRVPKNHIVIDFDLKDKDGKWPMIYGELSKSREGVHLHYIYRGKEIMNGTC